MKNTSKLKSSSFSYLEQLLGQYQTLPDEARTRNPNADKVAKDILKRAQENTSTLSDSDNLELALVELQSEEELTARVELLRHEYSEAVGVDTYTKYLQSSPPGVQRSGSALRADVRCLLSELHRQRVLEHAQNEVRKRALAWVLIGFLIVGICVVAVYKWNENVTNALVVLFGALGGLISVLQRIKSGRRLSTSSINSLAGC